jgi:hypothetical protein
VDMAKIQYRTYSIYSTVLPSCHVPIFLFETQKFFERRFEDTRSTSEELDWERRLRLRFAKTMIESS